MTDRILTVGLDEAAARLRAAGKRVLAAAHPDDAEGVPFCGAILDGSSAWAAGYLADHRARGRPEWMVAVGGRFPRLADVVAPDLEAGVAAVLALSLGRAPRWLRVGSRIVDLAGQRVLGAGPAPLSEAECALLAQLALAGPDGVGRDQLGRALGLRVQVGRAVDHAIGRLRNKLDRDHIRTVRGQGYALDAEVLDGPPARLPTEPPPPPPIPDLVDPDVLEVLRRAWSEGAPIVSIHGPPGSGKSAVARRFAAELGEVSYVDLSSGHVPPIPSGVVLVDDADRVSYPLAFAIRARLGADLRVLWTACEPAPLSTAFCFRVPPWTMSQATRLARARVGPEEGLEGLLARVIEGTAGNPLAIELALARLRLMNAGALDQRLQVDPLGALGDPSRRPARHRRWEDAIHWAKDAGFGSPDSPWAAAAWDSPRS